MLFLGPSLWVNRDPPLHFCPGPAPNTLAPGVRDRLSTSRSPWNVRLGKVPVSCVLLARPLFCLKFRPSLRSLSPGLIL